MRSLWDSVLWLRRKNKQDKEEILTAVNAVQNLFKTSGEATASASDIVAPKTAYNGTTLITGTIADKTGTSEYAATASIDNTNKKIKMQVPADGKYGTKNYLYQSFSNIASLIGLTASKLVKNNTVLGITGNSSNMDTSGCDAAAAQILSGKKAGVKGKVVTGTMVNRAGTTVQAAAVTQDDDNTYFAVPEAAYYDKNSKIATANSNLGKRKLSGLLMVKSEKIIRTAGITDYTLDKTTTAIQIDRAWFGSGCRNVAMNYKYSIVDNNISVSADATDFANKPFLYTIGIDCTLLASEVTSTEHNGTNSTYNFKVDSLPSDLTIDEIIVELTNTVIGSGQSDNYINFSYSYDSQSKTISVIPDIPVWTNTNWIANIYRL